MRILIMSRIFIKYFVLKYLIYLYLIIFKIINIHHNKSSTMIICDRSVLIVIDKMIESTDRTLQDIKQDNWTFGEMSVIFSDTKAAVLETSMSLSLQTVRELN